MNLVAYESENETLNIQPNPSTEYFMRESLLKINNPFSSFSLMNVYNKII